MHEERRGCYNYKLVAMSRMIHLHDSTVFIHRDGNITRKRHAHISVQRSTGMYHRDVRELTLTSEQSALTYSPSDVEAGNGAGSQLGIRLPRAT